VQSSNRLWAFPLLTFLPACVTVCPSPPLLPLPSSSLPLVLVHVHIQASIFGIDADKRVAIYSSTMRTGGSIIRLPFGREKQTKHSPSCGAYST